MQVGLVAFHYPSPEFRAEMLKRVRRAGEVIEAMPGCLGLDCWLDRVPTAGPSPSPTPPARLWRRRQPGRCRVGLAAEIQKEGTEVQAFHASVPRRCAA